MKKLFLLLFLMTISLGQSQNLITNGNFENGSVGWGNVTNVVADGSNNHYNSVNVTNATPGAPYTINLSFFNISIPTSGVSYKLTFDAWSDRNRTLLAGIGRNCCDYANASQTVNITNTPQTFTLTLTSNFADTASRILFDMAEQVGLVNIDNVKLELNVAPTPAPTAGPAAPTRSAGDVRSVFGATYINPDTYVVSSFGGSNVTNPYTLADNSSVIKYTAHQYSGITANGNDVAGGNFDVSTMTHLHMDVWSPDFVSFQVKLESTNGANVQVEVPFSKVQGSWNSYDIPLSSYSAVNLAAVKWIVPVTGDPKIMYITNVYFYKPAANAPVYGTFAIPDRISTDATFTITPPTSTNTSAFTYTSNNPSVATIVNGNQIDITGVGTADITASQVADGTRGAGSVTSTFVSTLLRNTPLTGPATPTRGAGVVKSVIGAAYSNAFGAPAFNNFGGSTIVGNVVLDDASTVVKYTGHDYSGLNAGGTDQGGNFNVTTAPAATFLHMDVWSPNFTSFEVKLESTNGAALLVNVPGAKTQRAWNSYDIPLSSYPGVNLAALKWIVLDSSPGAILFLTNVYFYQANLPTISGFSVPAKLNTDADFAITPPTTTNSGGAFSYTSSNTSVATIVSGNQINIISAGTTTITAIQAADGAFDAGSITASLVVTAAPLTTAAPTPPARNAWDVISLYSDAYTTQSTPIWNASSIVTDEVIAGEPTKKIVGQGAGGLVEIIDFAVTDVSVMEKLHMDIYSDNETAFNIWLLSNTNGDRNASISTPINGWRSIDIPLSTYVAAGLNMTNIKLLKFEGLNGQGKSIYVDNVYFYRSATLLPPTVGTFTVPAKFVGDANFTLTPPTSNNTSAFTYTSSNTAVATIVNGNQLHIISGGTSTITAKQVSDGSRGPSSSIASFVASFAAPGPSPTPTVPPAAVISMYTGTNGVYSNPDFTLARSSWTGVASATDISNGTGTALQVDNLGFIGLVDGVSERRINLTGTGMTKLHLDVYLDAPFANLFFWLLAPGDQRKDLTNLRKGWNSIDISLSAFPGANLSDIYGLKFEQNTGNPLRIYLDNIYFYNSNLTQLRPSFCGKTLRSLTDPIQASPLAGATEYTFEVTRVSNNAVTEIVSSTYKFNPATSIAGGLVWGAAYSVKVKVKIGGNYNPYGNACIVTVMAEPAPTVTKIRPFQCGKTLLYMTQPVEATPVYNATTYEFQVTSAAGTFVASSPNHTFSLFYSVPGRALTGTTYSIMVRSKGAATAFTAWGDPCDVKTPIARMSEVSTNDVFEVKAFPNPFASHFSLDIESSSDAQVEMKVYDMIGRQLEVRKASVSELSVLEVGRNYPTGIYNLVVSQGKNVKSIRMIKR